MVERFDESILEGSVGDNWFTNRVRHKVGNGRNTSFWKDRWRGDTPSCEVFPRLFTISNQKEAKVGDLWWIQDDIQGWNLSWRRQPFLWEEDLVVNLLAMLEGVVRGNEEDRWVWTPEEGGGFSVRSSYKVLEEALLLDEGSPRLEEEVFATLWKSPAPSKVVAFSWTALLDRIPTRSNLRRRNMLEPEESLLCVLCGEREETTTHLFLHCEVTSKIWRAMLNWFDINFITPHNLFAF